MRLMTTLWWMCCVLLVPTMALAGAPCGDDVGGVRVACRCGDVIVADVRLLPSDPVVRERCVSDGLLVRPRPGGHGLRVDLAGLEIHGSGRGTGIRVLGSSGVVIIGGSGGVKGRIRGFGTGVRASGTRSVTEVRNLIVEGNVRHGMLVRGRDAAVSDVTATANGGDGLRVSGRGAMVTRAETHGNGGSGVVVGRQNNTSGIRSSGNSRAQIRAMGHLTEVNR